jgi:hypothetical protein
LQTTPEHTPSRILACGGIKPDAGVAATKPEIIPEQKPTIDHFLDNRKSRSTHVTPENIAARFEFQHAITARRFDPNADPPLKPSHPNQSKIVPNVINETLCGLKFKSIFS